MLGANADALAQDAGAHGLVDDDTDTAGGDVPDDACATVVVLVWHTSTHRWVGLDVDVVADLERLQDPGGIRHTALAELLLEEVACAAAKTPRIDHGFFGAGDSTF